jgi:hypothetical protein
MTRRMVNGAHGEPGAHGVALASYAVFFIPLIRPRFPTVRSILMNLSASDARIEQLHAAKAFGPGSVLACRPLEAQAWPGAAECTLHAPFFLQSRSH